jgi:hypothetical protein
MAIIVFSVSYFYHFVLKEVWSCTPAYQNSMSYIILYFRKISYILPCAWYEFLYVFQIGLSKIIVLTIICFSGVFQYSDTLCNNAAKCLMLIEVHLS